MTVNRSLPARRSRGQSLTEMVVLMIVLLPLFLIVPLIGKYADIAHQTTNAARYGAFEITVNGPFATKDTATVQSEIQRRFFTTWDAPIKTGDVAGNTPNYRNPLWVDYRADQLIANVQTDVVHTRTVQDSPVPVGSNLPVAPSYSDFGLPVGNFYTSRVSTKPAVPARLTNWTGIDLTMNRQAGIITDTWAASGSAQVSSRVNGMGSAWSWPMDALKLAGTIFTPPVELLLDPAPSFGNPDPNIVPCDRLDPVPPSCQ